MESPAGAAANLTDFQLTAGLQLQRYETYVGPDHPPQMNFIDPSTAGIRADLGADRQVNGYGDYLGIIVAHPLTMAGVFVRHLVNGMDRRYSTPYVEHVDTGGQRLFRIGGLLLAFLGLLRVLWPAARRGLGPARWRYPAALLAMVLTTLPTAVEPRFMLPLFVLVTILAVAPGWPERLGIVSYGSALRRYAVPLAIAVGLVVFMTAAWAITAGATNHFQFGA